MPSIPVRERRVAGVQRQNARNPFAAASPRDSRAKNSSWMLIGGELRSIRGRREKMAVWLITDVSRRIKTEDPRMLAATQKEIERVSQYMRRLSSRNAVVGMMHSPSGGVERDSSPAASRLPRASACGSLQHDTWEPPVRNIGIYFWAGWVYGNSAWGKYQARGPSPCYWLRVVSQGIWAGAVRPNHGSSNRQQWRSGRKV
jgi:hypothetical protein